jgi:hypothetical protein
VFIYKYIYKYLLFKKRNRVWALQVVQLSEIEVVDERIFLFFLKERN